MAFLAAAFVSSRHPATQRIEAERKSRGRTRGANRYPVYPIAARYSLRYAGHCAAIRSRLRGSTFFGCGPPPERCVHGYPFMKNPLLGGPISHIADAAR